MNENIQLGLVNSLRIGRQTVNGFYLKSNNDEEVLLPNTYITQKMNLGDTIDVFIYTDSEDRLVATTLKPKIKKNEFGFLEVVEVRPFGAFVDIGLSKDLFVPANKQKVPFRIGDKRVIRMIEDVKTCRLIGIEKITSFLNNNTEKFKRNDEVEILVVSKTQLGFKVVVNNSHNGLVFKNEIFENIKVGDKKNAFVKNVRIDGKLDISLRLIGINNEDEVLNKIIDILNNNNRFLPLNYKSSPNDIKEIIGLSKKVFKKSLTALESKKIIIIKQDGIYLLKK